MGIPGTGDSTGGRVVILGGMADETPQAPEAQGKSADAFIVGSSVKSGGTWSGTLDAGRTRACVDALARC